MGKVHANGEEDDGPITVVLEVEMHCEGCTKKIRRCVKGFKGVEAVASDVKGSKLTVIGKVDPPELRNHLENKMHKKVDLISPAVVKKEKESSKAEGIEGAKDKKPDQGKEQKKADDKKQKEPSVTSVILKIQLHCLGCTKRIKKQIIKIKGVESISIDSEKDLVTVKGTMDVNILPGYLAAKLNKGVEIVTPNKSEDGDKEKSRKNKGYDNAAKGEAHDAASKKGEAQDATSKMENYDSWYVDYPYSVKMVDAPQLFSDENPNACFIM